MIDITTHSFYPVQGKKVFSQNDEDGALEAVFDYVATTDKIYVEFGVESCQECNSRYLRSVVGVR